MVSNERGKIMAETFPGTCVAPSGEFIYGIHKSKFTAINLRESDYIVTLGHGFDQGIIDNADNFPANDVFIDSSNWVFEIPNAFPFLGATYVIKSGADRTAGGCNPFHTLLKRQYEVGYDQDLQAQPRAVLLALASASADPDLLVRLAERSGRFALDEKTGAPIGLIYEKTENGEFRPAVLDRDLFQIVSNNPFLPNQYKRQMVLVPGAQGKSPVVGEHRDGDTHIWEYLRENSYIPWGHYAANMADDAVRYTVQSLTAGDVIGLRHLYYQRIYVQLAVELGLAVPVKRRSLAPGELEELRLTVLHEIDTRNKADVVLPFTGITWGQNFGFDLSPSGYRLGGSHQQIHQQFGLVPSQMDAFTEGKNETSAYTINTYAQTDMVGQFARDYRERTHQDFFEAYLKAIRNNKRMDGRADKEKDLIFYQDENVVAFVPKAQRSQGEVQLMTKVKCGNIVETDTETRNSLDHAMLLTMKVLEKLGVEMFTALEISKRLENPDSDQRLLYCFLPRHPRSPGGFSEFQQRWISNHYPEDFAKVCRDEVYKIMENDT
jgi:diadenosine tetraphosphate (Ap4A) HIT family hydrolase